jgi:hypothetical protein
MALTYELIASSTVGSGGTASVTFSSIPGTYTDLIVKGSVRGTNSGQVQQRILISFNGSSANYNFRTLNDAAGTPVYYDRSSFGDNNLAYIPAPDATANTFNNFELYFPNYTSSSFKSISVDGVMENNSSTNYNNLLGGLWSQTAAITSLTFSTNMAQHSTFYLYGIKSS